MKILWITADWSLDTDISLVPYIKANYSVEINWIVIQGVNNTSKLPYSKDYKLYKHRYRGKDPRIILDYKSIFDKEGLKNYDLIYSDMLGIPYYYPFLFFYSRKRIPIVHAAHNVMPYTKTYEDAWPKSLVIGVKYIFRYNNYFHLFSKVTAAYFKEHYPNKSMFYCPMSLKGYGAVRTDNYPISDSKVNLLFFGNVMGNKRLDLLIDVVKNLPCDVKDKVHLTIAGNCREQERFLKQIDGCENISAFFRRIDDDEIPELFTKHHFLMLPYEAVAQSGPHMIAYYYNLPVIASDIAGFVERVVDGENGFIFKVNDNRSLAMIIEKAVNLTNCEYGKMKANLKNYAEENFGLNTISQNYIRYFQSIANHE